MTPDRTAAAIEARRHATEQKLQQVSDAVASLRRHKAPVTYPAVARQAGFSELRDNAPAQRPVWPRRRNTGTAGNRSWQVDEDATDARVLPKADIRR